MSLPTKYDLSIPKFGFRFVLPTVYENEPVVDPPADKTFTKAELEAAVNAERQKVQKTINEQVTQLKTLQQSTNLTAQEKKELQERIGHLESEVMTKEELAKREQTQLAERFTNELKQTKAEKEIWENRFKASTIHQSIMSAAVDPTTDAHDPNIFNVLLASSAVLIEGKDAQGKPTGNFEVKIKKTKVEDGVTKELLYSPREAIGLMKEDKSFGYLFRNGDKAGAGLNNNGNPNGAAVDISQIKTFEEYQKHRDQILKGQ